MSDSIENTRKRIDMFLEVYSEEQLNFLELLMETFSTSYPTKTQLLELTMDKAKTFKCDSALPHDYVVMVQDILPCFRTFDYVYNYNEPTPHGAMFNVPGAIVDKMQQVFNNKNFKK